MAKYNDGLSHCQNFTYTVIRDKMIDLMHCERLSKEPVITLILASSSPHRRTLLARLAISFESASPEIDETALAGETPSQLVTRLAEAKARKVQHLYPEALIIGSDQVAVADGERVVTKPGTNDAARAQLLAASGRSLVFLTGLCLLNATNDTVQIDCVSNTVHFRTLTPEEIERYLKREKPYDCAGSFKSEGYGITLIRRIDGDDPTSLIGLPLISLAEMLRNEGVHLP